MRRLTLAALFAVLPLAAATATAGPAVAAPATTGYDGTDLRAAYGVTNVPVAATASVATIDLSGFRAADISHYALAYGLPDPVAGDRFRIISVDGADPTDTFEDVAADTATETAEALIAAAPGVPQRIYVAPYTFDGFADALQAVAEDAADPDRHIAALVVPELYCEIPIFYPGPPAGEPGRMLASMADAFKTLTGAGVTIFAASGDDGLDPCGFTPWTGADPPGEAPDVVSVGGTTLDTAAHTETGWRASGGGASDYPRPSWQSALTVAGTQRVYPDIAAVADPDTGLRSYISLLGGWTTRAGTTLAAALSAGLFTDELASAGYGHGLGDLHAALYAAPAADFRDIVAGGNGTYGETGYLAGPGYDEVSGLGRPDWDALAVDLLAPVLRQLPWVRPGAVPVRVSAPPDATYGRAGVDNPPGACTTAATTTSPPVEFGTVTTGTHTVWLEVSSAGVCRVLSATTTVDSTPPSVESRIQLTGPIPSWLDSEWKASWASVDRGMEAPPYQVTVVRRAEHTYSVSDVVETGDGSTDAAEAVEGFTYYLTVRARDSAGNVTTSVAHTAIPLDDDAAQYRMSQWDRHPSKGTYHLTIAASDIPGATMSRRAWGYSYRVWLSRGPRQGRAQFLLDGHLVRTVDLYATHHEVRQAVQVGSFAHAGSHVVTVRVTGTKRAAAEDAQVSVDAFIAVS